MHQWKQWSYQQGYDEARAAARAFISFGLPHYGTVSIYGFNAPEWHIASYGAIFSGAKVAGIYPTDTVEHVKYKNVHSDASVAVVEDKNKLARMKEALPDLPELKLIVVYGDASVAEDTIKGPKGNVAVIQWKTLIEKYGKPDKNLDMELDLRMNNCKPGDACVLVYTSGTTGNPKAVVLSHDNMCATAKHMLDMVRKSSPVYDTAPERILSYLPLSHVAAMMLDILGPVYHTAMSKGGYEMSVFFARAYDLKDGTIAGRLTFVNPTIFVGVPRVWEKIAEKIQTIGKKNTGLIKKLGDWAKGVMLE